MNVLLTCPRDLLFLLGITVDTRPGRRDPMSSIVAAAHELGGPVTHRKGRLSITLPDPVDAVLALRALQRALPEYEIHVVSLIASDAAVELLAGDNGPVRVAWQWLLDDIDPVEWRSILSELTPFDPPQPVDPMADVPRGMCAVSRFRARVNWREERPRSLARIPAPAAIADQQLPSSGLVLWSLAGSRPDDSIVHVERGPFVVGRDASCDLVLDGIAMASRHVQLERSDDGEWLVRDLKSPSGFYLNDQFGGEVQALQPGMVIRFAMPYALIVLSS